MFMVSVENWVREFLNRVSPCVLSKFLQLLYLVLFTMFTVYISCDLFGFSFMKLFKTKVRWISDKFDKFLISKEFKIRYNLNSS